MAKIKYFPNSNPGESAKIANLTVISSSYALTATFVTTAQTASYVQNAQTASYVTTAQTASYVSQAVSSSYASTISYDSISGSVKNDVYVSTMLSFTSISPADSTTYYIGYTGVPRTTNTDRDFPFPLTGIITDIDFYHIPTGLNGSADASTLYFENITQATSTNLGTFNITQGAQILRTNSFSGLSIAVTKGDSCVLRWDSAAWTTNPTNVIGGANIITKRS